jgi:ATP-dependent protease ClpP protease subunit
MEKIAKDTDRDCFLNAEEAKAYSVIDEIIVQKRCIEKELSQI